MKAIEPCEAEGNCVYDKPECATPAILECDPRSSRGGCRPYPGLVGLHREETSRERKARGCGNQIYRGGNYNGIHPKRDAKTLEAIENFVQNSGIEIIKKESSSKCTVTRNIIGLDGTSGNQTLTGTDKRPSYCNRTIG